MSESVRRSARNQWFISLVSIIVFGLDGLVCAELLSAKPLYSYRDDQGTNVVTDNYERIPSRYRAKVTTSEQEVDQSSAPTSLPAGVTKLMRKTGDPIGGFTINVPGMSHYQSHALTIAGCLAAICLLVRGFSRNQALRFLAQWGLVMLGIVTPLLIFFSQDAPLDRLSGQASQIQSKQLDHLKQAQ
jgi:hypothetical protein